MMKVEIFPSKVFGEITPPSSKSFLHRAIISASLAKGTSIIENVNYSDDVLATIGAFESLGVEFIKSEKTLIVNSPGKTMLDGEHEVNCNESGSTIRFLIPILSNDSNTYFKGKSTLLNRPMTIYEDIYNRQNLYYKKEEDFILTRGKIRPDNFQISGNISSQFISGLLFILPVLDSDSSIEILGDFESSDYVDLTISILEKFSVYVERKENHFFIKGNQTYYPTKIFAETDFSQMAFFAVLGTINNDIKVNGINFNSLQPDKRIISFIEFMGGKIIKDQNSAIFMHSNLRGDIIDISQSPDIGPILSVLAAKSNGKTSIVNAKRLVIKESNRLLSTYSSLKSLGAEVEMGDDYLVIHGPNKFVGNTCDSFNDHRIAMSLAIAGTVSESSVIIEGAEAINKSYPDFYKDLESLGVKIKYL